MIDLVDISSNRKKNIFALEFANLHVILNVQGTKRTPIFNIIER